jgi:hypothetical protein
MGVVLIVAAAVVAVAVVGWIKVAQLSRANRETAVNLQQINQQVAQALNELAETIGRHRTELSQVGQRAEDLTAALGEWLNITDELRESALAESRGNETRFAALREEVASFQATLAGDVRLPSPDE